MPGEAHEFTHIVAYRILGVPPPFFGEGLAIALDCAFRDYPDYPHKFCNAAIISLVAILGLTFYLRRR